MLKLWRKGRGKTRKKIETTCQLTVLQFLQWCASCRTFGLIKEYLAQNTSRIIIIYVSTQIWDLSLWRCVCKMCSSESDNCFQRTVSNLFIYMRHYSRKNANHTFESLVFTQGINLLHFYYPSHSLIMMKVWKLHLKICSKFSPTNPCMNQLLPYRINWKWTLDTTWKCLHDFSEFLYVASTNELWKKKKA